MPTSYNTVYGTVLFPIIFCCFCVLPMVFGRGHDPSKSCRTLLSQPETTLILSPVGLYILSPGKPPLSYPTYTEIIRGYCIVHAPLPHHFFLECFRAWSCALEHLQDSVVAAWNKLVPGRVVRHAPHLWKKITARTAVQQTGPLRYFRHEMPQTIKTEGGIL